MKKAIITLLSVLSLTLCATPALAGELDAALGIGTEPAARLGSTFGLRVGYQDKFLKLFPNASDNEFTQALLFRADVSYFSWKKDFSGAKLTFRRLPVFVGGRYFIPVDLGGAVLFSDGGIEVSFDKADAGACGPGFGCGSVSASDINAGVAAGIGVEVPLDESLTLGADLRWHLVSDNYFTLMGFVGIPIGN